MSDLFHLINLSSILLHNGVNWKYESKFKFICPIMNKFVWWPCVKVDNNKNKLNPDYSVDNNLVSIYLII